MSAISNYGGTQPTQDNGKFLRYFMEQIDQSVVDGVEAEQNAIKSKRNERQRERIDKLKAIAKETAEE